MYHKILESGVHSNGSRKIHALGHGNIHSERHGNGHGNPQIDIDPNMQSNPKHNSEKPHFLYFI